MNIKYHYCLLRYFHDVTVGEFANVGVALYSAEGKFLRLRFNSQYRRLNEFFGPINHNDYRSILNSVSETFSDFAADLSATQKSIYSNTQKGILPIAEAALPRDDSSFRWSEERGGLTDDLEATLESLFQRYVPRHDYKRDRRGDDDVWKSFHSALKVKNVERYLTARKIASPFIQCEFPHTYQNGVVNILQPLSFDLVSSTHIQEKAAKWFGIFDNLAQSDQAFKVMFLIAKPDATELETPFSKAESILNRLDCPKEFWEEKHAGRLSEKIAAEAH